ncbi:MAG: prolipoprotein diacylglyceryl transferase [Alteromonadaceae bacterium]|nr:prolipoprotein diacylglyceryl transferase [Alteromonadaceae bacterium]
MIESFITYPSIDPIIFTIGSLTLHWYAIMYLLGFASVTFLITNKADKERRLWPDKQMNDLLFYCFLGVILGGRVGYVIFYQFDYLLVEPLYIFKIWSGGMSFYGGLLGVAFVIRWFSKQTNKHFLAVSDFVVPFVPVGLAFGFIGDFINAEFLGSSTNVPWAIIFPTDEHQLPRHPLQLYEFLLEGVALFFILQFISRKTNILGLVSGSFLISWGLIPRSLLRFG